MKSGPVRASDFSVDDRSGGRILRTVAVVERDKPSGDPLLHHDERELGTAN